MPRAASHVFPNVPRHITQRRNRREDVFFCDDDRQLYLEWLVDLHAYQTVSQYSVVVFNKRSQIVGVSGNYK